MPPVGQLTRELDDHQGDVVVGVGVEHPVDEVVGHDLEIARRALGHRGKSL